MYNKLKVWGNTKVETDNKREAICNLMAIVIILYGIAFFVSKFEWGI